MACWNVLADCYFHAQKLSSQLIGISPKTTPLSSSNSLKTITSLPSTIDGFSERELNLWEKRSDLLCSTIEACKQRSIDLFLLQEIDHYEDFYRPLFSHLNYSCLYLQRPGREDGCLIAYNANKLSLTSREDIQFDDLASYQIKGYQQKHFLKQNVGIFAAFSFISEPSISFVSANCHLYWNPNKPEIKEAQAIYAMYLLHSFASESTGKYMKDCGKVTEPNIIFAGDFNSLPASSVYDFIRHGFDSLKSTSHHLSHAHTIAYNAFKAKRSHVIKSNVPEVLVDSKDVSSKKVKFLCDASLSRLCRWLRMLGFSTALEVINTEYDKDERIRSLFNRARSDDMILLTSSKGMLERANCPRSFYIDSSNLEKSLIELFEFFMLEADKKNILSVCGKCGGEVESCRNDDPRLHNWIASRKIEKSRTDNLSNFFELSSREIFICVSCSQVKG